MVGGSADRGNRKNAQLLAENERSSPLAHAQDGARMALLQGEKPV
jgi:hypothetical protein